MKFKSFETNNDDSGRLMEDVRVSLIMIHIMPDNSVEILSTADEVGNALIRSDAIMVVISSPNEKIDEA